MTDARPSSTVQAYATALYNAAKSRDEVGRIVEDCKALVQILDEQPTFAVFLEGPQIPREEKRVLVNKVFKERLSPLVMNLFYITIDRGRAGLIPGVVGELIGVAERADGIYPATVTSARELGSEERLNLKTSLEKYAGCQLRVRHDIETDLLGGIVFRFKDVLVDGSIRNKLRQMREKLMRRVGSFG